MVAERGERADEQDPARFAGDPAAVRAVFESMSVGLVALDGPELRFVAANAAYRAFIGRDDFLGRTLREVVPDVAGQQVVEMLERVYATGRAETNREFRIQLVIDGAVRESFVHTTVAPRLGPDGSPVGVNCHFVDVTPEVRARQADRLRADVAERRYEQSRDLVDALQRELLPPGLPVLPGTRIAASYLLADDGPGSGPAAGGDWFDAIPRPGGRVALVVGDVVGHGIAASAVMGQLRAVLADRLDDGAELPVALDAVDRFARLHPAARAATVCVAELDPADGTLTYVLAGHPPPLLVPAGGEARFLPGTGAGPLGTARRGAVALGTARLDVGDLVLLYSDGIVERPGREPAGATVELARVATDTAAGRSFDTGETSAVERVCTQTVELLVRSTGHIDDITLLAAQRVAPVPPLELTAPAGLPVVPAVRVAFDDWLRALGATVDDTFALLHAVGELVTNGVEHAYVGTEPGDLTVRAELTGAGAVSVTVGDRGRWHDAVPDPRRRRGLGLTRDLVDDLHVERTTDGTTATLTRRLTRPARLLGPDEVPTGGPGPRPPDPVRLLVTDLPADAGAVRIRVEGALDAVTTPELRRELLHRTRGGTRPTAVDLSGVTHLASAAVSVLHETLPCLQLFAPPGSVAQHVLDLVALPYDRPPDP